MGQHEDALEGLPEPGEPVFYPKVGHCIYRGVTEDRVAPGTELLELEDMEEGSRILIPVSRVPQLNLRPAGTYFEEIKSALSSEFEETLEDDDERHALIEKLVTDGSPGALSRALKRLHLLRQTTGLAREEEQTRKKIRSWLAAEVAISRECTRAEAQAFMTRVLQETMAAHRRKEKEEAKERRRAAREQKKAEEASAEEGVPVEETASATASESSDAQAPSEAELAQPSEPQESATEEEKEPPPAATIEDTAELPREASETPHRGTEDSPFGS